MKHAIWIITSIIILAVVLAYSQMQPPSSSSIDQTPIMNNESMISKMNYSTIPIIDPENSDEWREVNASNIARIALEDERAQQLLQNGGEIAGLLFISGPTPKSGSDPVIGPGLRIDYKEISIDFLVDESKNSVVRTIFTVPSDTHVEYIDDEIIVTKDGKLLLRMNQSKGVR